MVDWGHLALGATLLWAPGLALAWAFLPRLDWAKFLFLSVILALTVPGAMLFVLNVFFGVPLSPFNEALVALLVTSFAAAWGVRPRLDRLWG